MASIGHIAVGMAAARAYGAKGVPTWSLLTSMLAWSALSLLPDADVIGFKLGIKYGDAWGHRGASHSIAFALVIAALLAFVAPYFRRHSVRTFVFAAVVIASHPLLDTLTDGGLGCALWWPFEHHRHFAPWRPIPVAPIGARFFSNTGFQVALVELLLFGPLFIYAVWPRRKPSSVETTHGD